MSRGNAKIVGFSSNREAKVNLEDCVFTNEAIAMMTGNDLTTGAKNIYKREELTVGTNAATLSKTPVGALIGLYELNADGSNGTEITLTEGVLSTGEFDITAKAISLFAGDYASGDKLVAYYKIATDATAKTITVSSDKFAGSFRLVLDCLVRDAYLKTDFEAQIEIPNCKMEDNWSITMAAEGDPSVFTMPIEVLKPSTSTDMWTMVVYDESLAS